MHSIDELIVDFHTSPPARQNFDIPLFVVANRYGLDRLPGFLDTIGYDDADGSRTDKNGNPKFVLRQSGKAQAIVVCPNIGLAEEAKRVIDVNVRAP